MEMTAPVEFGGFVELVQPDVDVRDREADGDAARPEVIDVPQPSQRVVLQPAHSSIDTSMPRLQTV